MRELLAHGADVNIMDNYGWTPLMHASYYCSLAVVRLLCVAPGIDLVARSSNSGRTALGLALHKDRAEVAAFQRSRGAPE